MRRAARAPSSSAQQKQEQQHRQRPAGAHGTRRAHGLLCVCSVNKVTQARGASGNSVCKSLRGSRTGWPPSLPRVQHGAGNSHRGSGGVQPAFCSVRTASGAGASTLEPAQQPRPTDRRVVNGTPLPRHSKLSVCLAAGAL